MKISPEMQATLLISSILAMIGMLLAMSNARAETCREKIDNSIERRGGYRWQWRMIDGRKCWYYSNNVLMREDLVWSYTEEEFNSDIDRVIERKFYPRVDAVGNRGDD